MGSSRYVALVTCTPRAIVIDVDDNINIDEDDDVDDDGSSFASSSRSSQSTSTSPRLHSRGSPSTHTPVVLSDTVTRVTCRWARRRR
eukprot:9251140-Pyramimonas_sp.AAC.3